MATTEMTDDMVSSIAYDRKTKTIYEIRSDGQRVPIRVRCDEQHAEKA